MKVVTIGGAMRDIFLDYKEKKEKDGFLFLRIGEKIEIEKLLFYTGGGATNSAVSFRRLGFETASIFKVGDDIHGSFIVDKLKHENIDLDSIIVDKKRMTGMSVILPSIEGGRVVLAYRGANAFIKLEEVQKRKIRESDLLFLTSLSKSSKKIVEPIVDFAYDLNKIIAINPSMEQLKDPNFIKILKKIDMLMLNKFEASMLFSSLKHVNSTNLIKSRKDFINFFQEVLLSGVKIVAVTDGSNGIYAASGQRMFFCPIIKVKVVNTLGAGDAFAAGFAADWILNKDIRHAMAVGAINASSVVGFLDAKTGLLTKRELSLKLEKIDFKKIKVFNF